MYLGPKNIYDRVTYCTVSTHAVWYPLHGTRQIDRVPVANTVSEGTKKYEYFFGRAPNVRDQMDAIPFNNIRRILTGGLIIDIGCWQQQKAYAKNYTRLNVQYI